MFYYNIKSNLNLILPKPLSETLRLFYNYQDIFATIRFLLNSEINISIYEKIKIILKLYKISYLIDCPHTQEEIISFMTLILQKQANVSGCIVEAGNYKGGSSAKFSLAVKIAGRELVIFDSFEGIPEHNEHHDKSIYGAPIVFDKGSYCGTLEEVKKNIAKYGCIAGLSGRHFACRES